MFTVIQYNSASPDVVSSRLHYISRENTQKLNDDIIINSFSLQQKISTVKPLT